MNYIVFDLEWNNAYNYRLKSGMNEIIEIGAVKLDENLKVLDTFKQLIKPQISKKLGSRVKNLTHITIEEINRYGVSFNDAFDMFERWCSDGDNLFLTWSRSDLYTLAANFKYFDDCAYISFIKKYADAQEYCMSFIEGANASHQISLEHCAEIFEINVDDVNFHRALEDCMITAYCFKEVFDEQRLKKYIDLCDISFFERLLYKPTYIKNPKSDLFNIDKVKFICPQCKGSVIPINDYQFSNNTFRGAGQCERCKKKYWTYVRAKKTYDAVIISSRVVKINKKRAKNIG